MIQVDYCRYLVNGNAREARVKLAIYQLGARLANSVCFISLRCSLGTSIFEAEIFCTTNQLSIEIVILSAYVNFERNEKKNATFVGVLIVIKIKRSVLFPIRHRFSKHRRKEK